MTRFEKLETAAIIAIGVFVGNAMFLLLIRANMESIVARILTEVLKYI